jgi:hypothetical protein
MKRLVRKRSRDSVWIAAAGCVLLAIQAPATGTQAAGTELAAQGQPKMATVSIRTLDQAPPQLRDIQDALSGMVVAIDPATGELRAPTQDEHARLTGSATARRALLQPQSIEVGGISGLPANASSIEFLTAVQDSGGRVTFRCVHGLDSSSPTFAADHSRLSQEVR